MNGEILLASNIVWQDTRFPNRSSWNFAGLHHTPFELYQSSPKYNTVPGFNQHFHPFQNSNISSFDSHIHQQRMSEQPSSYGRGIPLPYDAYPAYGYRTSFGPSCGPDAGNWPYQHPRQSLAAPHGSSSFAQQVTGHQVHATQRSNNPPGSTATGSSCSHCQNYMTPSPRSVIDPTSPILPRGPPRKPKRSGHAVWVGNIPLGSSIEVLKDHFSKDATADIESVFLMAKSNCAFINYQTEGACVAAVDRFNHSLFGSVRLLCRLRCDTAIRHASSSSTQPTAGPERHDSLTSSMQGKNEHAIELSDTLQGGSMPPDASKDPSILPEDSPPEEDQIAAAPSLPADRYFIVKSLTKEDLQDSLLKGTWETQTHNQQVFADAYRDCSNVYLIFSVNKSGDYFGYARMVSSPAENTIASSANVSSSLPDENHPTTLKIVRTAATDTAPRGYIVEDTVRGTIFWEAEHDLNSIVSSDSQTLERGMENVHSRPFRVEWLSVRRVTFQRTKGIRNPWNLNKEVKVARDGTELETEVGKRLVGLFHEDSSVNS